MAISGALDYIFDRKGVFIVNKPEGDLEELELNLIDHHLEDLFETETGLLMYSSFEEFNALQRAIDAQGLIVQSAGLQRVPKTFTTIDADQEVELDKLVSMLEEDDDVQHVYHNARLAE